MKTVEAERRAHAAGKAEGMAEMRKEALNIAMEECDACDGTVTLHYPRHKG